MNVKELEKIVLKKLKDGVLDGIVGNDFNVGDYATVTYRKIIKDGIPKILRMSPDSKFFNNKENVKIAGKVTEEVFKTIPEKLLFLQKYGWLLDDPDVKAYSALFKPKK